AQPDGESACSEGRACLDLSNPVAARLDSPKVLQIIANIPLLAKLAPLARQARRRPTGLAVQRVERRGAPPVRRPDLLGQAGELGKVLLAAGHLGLPPGCVDGQD